MAIILQQFQQLPPRTSIYRLLILHKTKAYATAMQQLGSDQEYDISLCALELLVRPQHFVLRRTDY